MGRSEDTEVSVHGVGSFFLNLEALPLESLKGDVGGGGVSVSPFVTEGTIVNT